MRVCFAENTKPFVVETHEVGERVVRSGIPDFAHADFRLCGECSHGKKREAVQLLVSEEDSTLLHEFDTISDPAGFRVLNLAPLVSMNLNQNRNVNRMYVRDLVEVGLIDRTWTAKLPPTQAERLQQLLETPDG